MNEAITGFAAVALLGFAVMSALLMVFMALVQPIWCLIDCAINGRRGTAGKVVWILALILLWGVANWFYGAFAASGRALLGLTRLAWALAIALGVAFVVMLWQSDEFRRGFEREWRDIGGAVTVQAPPAAGPRSARG